MGQEDRDRLLNDVSFYKTHINSSLDYICKMEKEKGRPIRESLIESFKWQILKPEYSSIEEFKAAVRWWVNELNHVDKETMKQLLSSALQAIQEYIEKQ